MGGKKEQPVSSQGSGGRRLLPFILGFFLFAFAGWLFLPYFLQNEFTLSLDTQNPSKAVAELMHENLPDHVFFSDQAHSRDTCNQCHTFSPEEYLTIFKMRAIEQKQTDSEKKALFYQANPMTMAECESCHAISAHIKSTSAGTACDTCHK